MRIIAYRRHNDIDIEFLDEHHYIREHAAYTNFTRGNIQNPYDKSLHNIGYLGEGIYKAKDNNRKITASYHKWYMMIDRCYNPDSKERFPAYYEISTVCEEWHNYQTFAKWFQENEYECTGRLHLDKDILVPGNKVYSPDTCLLVPQRINMLFTNKPNDNGLPNGIRQTSFGRYSAIYNHNDLGVYSTIEEAYKAYAIAKEKVIREVAEEYKTIIPNKVYDALMRYKVDIKNDKNYLG